jgi:hypothetical protein
MLFLFTVLNFYLIFDCYYVIQKMFSLLRCLAKKYHSISNIYEACKTSNHAEIKVFKHSI